MDETFRCRINNVDHYQALPVEGLDPEVPTLSTSGSRKDLPRVSVIRVFGVTHSGQKVLMHVHGAFQYLYLEYSGPLDDQDVCAAIQSLYLAIDRALAVSYRKNPFDPHSKYVAHISLVKGTPFYGFHVGYKFYFKIYLLNPLHVTRLADLLREGAILKRVLQPYESHMQFVPQWMCDYNLYGCAYVECAKVYFRSPVPSALDMKSEAHDWHDQTIPEQLILDEADLPKQSHCQLEVDVCVHDILNHRHLEERSLHHDFIERIKPVPEGMKLVQSMAGLWKDETRRRQKRMGIRDSNSSPFPPEVLLTMSANPRETENMEWIHEKEFREKIGQLIEEEKWVDSEQTVDFDTFVHPLPLEDLVQTAWESVEDLYPPELCRRRPAREGQIPIGGLAKTKDGHAASDDLMVETSDVVLGSSGTNSTFEDLFTDANGNTQLHSTGSTVDFPVAISKQANFGIRSCTEPLNLDVDDFRIGDDYFNEEELVPPSSKRSRLFSELLSSQKQNKRQKTQSSFVSLLEETFKAYNPDHGGHRKKEPRLESHIREEREVTTPTSAQISDEEPTTNNVPRSSQISVCGTIRFPVVKNPFDPNTIARLSQQSSTSVTLSQEAAKPTANAPSKPSEKGTSPTQYQTWSPIQSNDSSGSPIATPMKLDGFERPRHHKPLKVLNVMPPSSLFVTETMSKFGRPDIIYRKPYFSKEQDVPRRVREYAGRKFKLESETLPFLPKFNTKSDPAIPCDEDASKVVDRRRLRKLDRQRKRNVSHRTWCIVTTPPTCEEVSVWARRQRSTTSSRHFPKHSETSYASQIERFTQGDPFDFKSQRRMKSSNIDYETQYMSLMSLEIHVKTRGALVPDPHEDEIGCVFWCLQSDDEDIKPNTPDGNMHLGILALSDGRPLTKLIARSVGFETEEESTELELLMRMVDIVRFYDPDILTGYEVHNSSWGFLIERARVKYDMNFCDEISRMKSQSYGRFGKEEDRWGFNQTSTVRVTGRHTINIWRAMRGEMSLQQYTMENVALKVLGQRIPHYQFSDLTTWYDSKNPREFARVVEYYSLRAQLDLQILDANELVSRTSEQARLIGVDWFSVISRGSQFKVENIMFRIAKPENLILVSPSRRQVGGQNALECLPLVMEPQSDFYTSPMVVLDFQSLYPSVMIAYNYCYSTFLGRVVGWRGTNKMGFANYQRQKRLLELLKDHINIAPNGIMYAKSEIRKSLLAKMLSEILETRFMVKSGMKIDKSDEALQRLLNNRQLALKLIANVTYGYTSASFSGRMPCVEIADSIVQTGRETLEKAMALISSVERWNAEVVYGDTDSLFVYLKGRTREQAFDIGEEIAEAVTNMNPRPIKLKFEKVYHPCVLLAKKRYVGFKYESRLQTKPEFEAKGIETVRRDGTPAEQKIEESALKLLFRTCDLSQVKAYFKRQCTKIMKGKVSIQDFCFAKEVKLGTYSDKGAPTPGALISARRMLQDARLEPQYGERVPYVVVTGAPGARLIDRCVAPEVLINNPQQALDAEYYISKNIIPPLERIFNLVGANVRDWYDRMPKHRPIRRVAGLEARIPKSRRTLEWYLKPSFCMICRTRLKSTNGEICDRCTKQISQSLLTLRLRLNQMERKGRRIDAACRSCSGLTANEEVKCDSKDCPLFYARAKHQTQMTVSKAENMPLIQQLDDKFNERFEKALQW